MCLHTDGQVLREEKHQTRKQKNKKTTIKIFIKWKRQTATLVLKCSLIPAFREKKAWHKETSHSRYVHTGQFLGFFCKHGNYPAGSSLSSPNHLVYGNTRLRSWRCRWAKRIWIVFKKPTSCLTGCLHTKIDDKLRLFTKMANFEIHTGNTNTHHMPNA